MHGEVQKSKPDVAAVTLPVEWLLALKSPKGTSEDLHLTDGAWVIGSGPLADVMVADPAIAAMHLRIDVSGNTAQVEVLAASGARLSHPSGLVNIPATSRMQLTPGRRLQWVLGDWTATLHATADTSAAGLTGLQKPLAMAGTRRGRWAASLLVLTLAIGAGLSWMQADALASARPARAIAKKNIPGTSQVDIASTLAASPLSALLTVKPGEGNAPPEVHGTLVDAAQCELMVALRQAVGPSRFADRVACMPALEQSAVEYLRDTGVTAKAVDKRLVLQGVADNAVARGRVATVLGSMQGLVDVDSTGVSQKDDKPNLEGFERKARARIASAQVGNPGYVVTPGGEYVYIGGALMPGVELLAVKDAHVTLRTAGHTVDVAL